MGAFSTAAGDTLPNVPDLIQHRMARRTLSSEASAPGQGGGSGELVDPGVQVSQQLAGWLAGCWEGFQGFQPEAAAGKCGAESGRQALQAGQQLSRRGSHNVLLSPLPALRRRAPPRCAAAAIAPLRWAVWATAAGLTSGGRRGRWGRGQARGGWRRSRSEPPSSCSLCRCCVALLCAQWA